MTCQGFRIPVKHLGTDGKYKLLYTHTNTFFSKMCMIQWKY